MEGGSRWVAVACVAPVSWGATYFVTRHLLPSSAPLWGATFRALPAGLMLLAVARSRPRGPWWWRGPVLGVLNFGVFFVLVYVAAQTLPTSTATAVTGLAPLALTVFAWPLLGQRPAVRALVGGFAGLVGVALMAGFAVHGLRWGGIAASAGALVVSSFGATLATRWRGEVSLLASTSWQLVAAGALLGVGALVIEGAPPAVDAPAVTAYAGVTVVSTAFAFVCWFAALRRLPAGLVGLCGLLNPVTGAVLGIALGGERLSPLQVLGLVTVVAAVCLGRPREAPQLPGTARPRGRGRDDRWRGREGSAQAASTEARPR